MIVEDGTIVANANSYVTVEEFRAYATDRNITLPVDNDIVAGHLVSACDYLESRRRDYKGVKTDPTTQPLQWPRADVYIDGVLLDQNTIPTVLKFAQFQLAIEKIQGVDLLPTNDEPFVVKEEVGAIKTTYSDDVAVNAPPRMRSVENWLEPLLNYGFGQLRTLRI